MVATPEQQAALQDLTNGWFQERLFEAVAAVGDTESAARIAGINPSTVYRHQQTDATFAAGLRLARARFGQRLVGKVTAAVMSATSEQLVKTPTAAIAAVNWFNPELRPNAGAIQVTVNTVNLLSDKQAEDVARALAGIPEGETVP